MTNRAVQAAGDTVPAEAVEATAKAIHDVLCKSETYSNGEPLGCAWYEAEGFKECDISGFTPMAKAALAAAAPLIVARTRRELEATVQLAEFRLDELQKAEAEVDRLTAEQDALVDESTKRGAEIVALGRRFVEVTAERDAARFERDTDCRDKALRAGIHTISDERWKS